MFVGSFKVEENFGRLGIMDFFNVLFTGGIFIVCACWICPWFWEQYLKVNLKTERYVVILVISFTIGLILQEIGVFWDKKIGHIEENVLSNFLSRNAIFTNNKVGMIKRIGNDIIGNEFKLQEYRKCGKEILISKSIDFKNDFTEEQCRYIYAYCFYYIENRGKTGKYEKMRGLFDLARTLTASSMILSIWSGLAFIYRIIVSQYSVESLVNVPQMILFGFIAYIFYVRAKRIMCYRVRMMMGVYESCKDNESQRGNG